MERSGFPPSSIGYRRKEATGGENPDVLAQV